ncbi:hypothetical protein [Capillimicrobium parvum]|nr:hypothetical protein [Capillimicrobium parvum]
MSSRSALLAAGLAVVALALVPAAAGAVSPACRALPLKVSLSSSDPTVLEDDPTAVVSPLRGASINDPRVVLKRNGRTYAQGSLAGRLARGRTAIALRVVPGRRIRAGRYRLAVAGKRSGCSSRTTASRRWRFGTPSLPVRAAPVSTLVSDNDGQVRLLLRSVGRHSVSDVKVSLMDPAGATVAQAAHRGAFTGQVSIDLPLAGRPSPGRYTLKVTGRTDGTALRSEQPLAFAPGGGSAGADTAPQTGAAVQRVVVDWSGGAWQGRDVAGFVAPGIGYGEIVCRPDAQWIRFYPSDLNREVAMMNWTYKDWSENQEKAIREALHDRYTGPDFREGLNKFGPAEKLSTGEYEGIISDRGPFDNIGAASLAAPTTLKLTWQWDLGQSGGERCHVEGTFTSQTASSTPPVARSAQVLWRGDANAAGRDGASVEVPGVGTLAIACRPGPLGTRALTVDTAQGATVTTREGSDDFGRPQDVGPVSANLPNNGMIAIRFSGGATLLASSRWKVNDPDQTQNFCAIAAQAVAPG